MEEQWRPIDFFPGYSVSDHGRVRSDKTGRLLSLSQNQYGLVHVGLMKEGVQYHRSLPLLVAREFLPAAAGPFDTPINLDGDRFNNRVDNLAWRPRWFAVKYNHQFKYPYENRINEPIVNLKTGEIYENSLVCAMDHGVLEEELVYAILNHGYVWPIYQEFAVA